MTIRSRAQAPLRHAACLLLAAAVATPAAAAPATLTPTGKWNVDFGDAHCIAMRNYGTTEKPLLLAFKPSPIGEVMQVSIVRPGGRGSANQYPGLMTVDGSAPTSISVLGYSAKSGKNRVSSINLPLADFRRVRTARTLALRSPGEMDYAFALSDLDAVARTLDRCVAGLRQVWNIENQTGVVVQPARAEKSPPSLFDYRDYPAVALKASDSGVVALVILIDEAGKIASCQATASSGAASLDAQSCAVLTERARFQPALGADGKPVKTGMTLRIRWAMSR